MAHSVSQLTVFAKDHVTGDRYQVADAQVEYVEDTLNGVPQASIKFNPFGQGATQIILGIRDLEVWEDTNIIFSGPLRTTQGNSTELTSVAEGIFDMFRYRFVLEDNLIFTDEEQLSIAEALIDYAQDAIQGTYADLNVVVAGFSASGILRSRTYVSERKHNMFEALTEFATLEEGFDQAFTPQPDGTHLWTPYFPSKGTVRTDLPLEYGREIIDYTYRADWKKAATKVSATGGVAEQVDGERLKNVFTYEDTAASALRRVHVSVLPSGARSDVAWLESRATRAVELRKSPVVITEIVIDNARYPIRSELEVGDSVPVRIDHGAIQVGNTYRIQKIRYEPQANHLKLTFLEPEE